MKKLKKSLSKLYEKAKVFLKKIKPSDRVVIVYHKDVDGLCAAVLLAKVIQKITGKEPVIIPRKGAGVTIDEKTKNKVLSFSPSVIIITDLAVDQDYKKVIDLHKISKAKLMIIDHHSIAHHFKKNILQINPRFYIKNIYLPTSYLIYRIVKLLILTKDLEWIAALGVIGDMGEKNCKDLIKKIDRKTKKLLYEANMLLSSGRFIEKDSSYFFLRDLMKKSKSPEEIVQNKKLAKFKKIAEKEIEKLKKKFKKEREKINKYVLFFSFKSKFDVGSALSSKLFDENRKNTIILVQKKPEELKVYARSWKTDVGVLLTEVLKGIGTGGGHPFAAGGETNPKNFEKLKRNLINFFKKKPKI